ncbi:MAG: pentapeptide repeat-containing protein [Cryomorphaceae bacterium]
MFRFIVVFWISFVLVAGGLALWVRSLSQSNEALREQLDEQEAAVLRQAEMISSLQAAESTLGMIAFLQGIQAELDGSTDHRLSIRSIEDIAALSKALGPYQYPAGDSLINLPLSPERGQLLMALVHMDLDSADFMKIKASASFAFADLHEADLQGTDLGGIDLNGAHLKKANLRGCTFHKATLVEAKLWNADLSGADMRYADFRRADLRWALLTEANLHRTNVNGALFHAAKMDFADLRMADVRWAKFVGTQLSYSDFEGTNLKGAALTRANLSGARFCHARFSRTALDEAVFHETEFDSARIEDKNWFSALAKSDVIGLSEHKELYEVAKDEEALFLVPRK